MTDNEPLLAFVDETGDRGYSPKSSEYFAMAAVIYPASVQQKVKESISKIKTKMRIPLSVPLHWYKHCRKHETRRYVTEELAKIEGVTVIYVISDKKNVPVDQSMFYNFVAALTLERILKHAEICNANVNVWFGHVKGFNHDTTINYLQKWDWGLVNYNRLVDQPKWIPAENNTGIQLADQYSSILGAAMVTDNYGNFEPYYIEKIKHQIRGKNGKICGYGIKAISLDNDPKSFKWWIKGWE